MQKPQKTFVDYLVVAISPILIMLLIGSLAFFLIQVFFRGEMVHGVRWVMFWFVMAIVLVARIGIEQGKGHARFYGAALAIATWFYLGHTQKTFMLGAVLLAIIWWCANLLTVDCTLINEDEDASGEGVLQGLWRRIEKTIVLPEPILKPPPPRSPIDAMIAAELAKRRVKKPSRPPGRSAVYFSLAALPLFGFGQLFLPADDPHARRVGFAFLAVYLSATLSLLAATSFLGLRRYLRQRSVEMPTTVALAWMKFGVLLGAGVLLLAMILPRPGANSTWKNLTYRIEHKEHKANDYALPFNPPGEGSGAPSDLPPERTSTGFDSKSPSGGSGGRNNSKTDVPSNPRNQSDQPSQSSGGTGQNGDQGTSQQDGRSGNSAPENHSTPPQNVRLRDSVPSGGGDQSEEKDLPDGQNQMNREGGGNQVHVTQSQDRRIKPEQSQPPKSKPGKSAPREKQSDQPEQEPKENATPLPKQPSHVLQQLLRVLLIVAAAVLFLWLLIRYRKVIADMIRSFVKAVREFLQKLFSIRLRKKAAAEAGNVLPPAPTLQPFATYENPFLSGRDKIWPAERLLRYTYEAVQAWAKEQRIEIRPEQTPREFCAKLIVRFPDLGSELEQFSFFYCHVAFAEQLPEEFETDSIRQLWRFMGDSVMILSSR